MTSPLENLCGPAGTLSKEPPEAREFEGLKQSGLRRLADAGQQAVSLEGRFDLAYNAAHALCLAALRQLGYRARNRYVVFQVLPHTLDLGPEVWGCSPGATTFATAASTREISRWMSAWLRI